MATVQLIGGRIVEHVQLTDIQHVGEEGSRRAIAHIEGKEYPVYNSIVDGFDPTWYEQIPTTIPNEALLVRIRTLQVVSAIQQAHVDGHIDLETYNRLFEVAQLADIAMRKLVDRLVA